jgi:ribonuclease G
MSKSLQEYILFKTEKILGNIIIVNREAWETRVAVLENEVLQDLYFDRKDSPSLEKGFIKGKVTNVLPGIQTVFVEIGQAKAGFLHISEVDRDFAIEKFSKGGELAANEITPRKKIHKNQINISKIFKSKDEILIQVKKEAFDSKGAKLTTCFTMPGKYLVLMPNIDHIGVSSKIESKAERSRLRDLMDKLLPEEMGVIIRTDAESKSEADLKRDLQLLITSWEEINQKYKTAKVGEFLHMDIPLAARIIREHIDNENVTIFCDNAEDLSVMKNFIKKCIPENNVKLILETKDNLFKKFDIDKQINNLLKQKVHLSSGGNIVIEHTEAMTVIDVNSAKFVGKGDQEETTLKINLEAAKESVRQLRLRNIGGIIIIDFIDMHKTNNKQTLMNLLHEELKKRDKLKSVTLNISELGLIQMTRKRSGKSLEQQLMEPCTTCFGTGVKKTNSTISSDILRLIKENIIISKMQGKKIEINLSETTFDYMTKNRYEAVLSIEKNFNCKIVLVKNKKINKEEILVNLLNS